MKNKKLLKRAKAYADSTEGVFKVRYTETPLDAVGNDSWWGCKYFLSLSMRITLRKLSEHKLS
ncbi:MAG: hypothetical protein ACLTVX_11995 [Anaerostipes caccae]|uniref:hypothetical protein n=1 Tax=Anaerostipes caccae TaxID=105841 RepID=UPI00399613B0